MQLPTPWATTTGVDQAAGVFTPHADEHALECAPEQKADLVSQRDQSIDAMRLYLNSIAENMKRMTELAKAMKDTQDRQQRIIEQLQENTSAMHAAYADEFARLQSQIDTLSARKPPL